MPDLNLIPAEYQSPPLLSRERLLMLLIAVELLLAVLLFRVYGEDSISTLKGFLGMENQSPQVVAQNVRTAQIEQARAALANLEAAQVEMSNQKAQWPHLLDLIFNQAPPGLTVTSFRQSEDTVTLTGSAKQQQDVFDYEDILQQSPFILQVREQATGASGEGRGFTLQVTLRKGVNVE